MFFIFSCNCNVHEDCSLLGKLHKLCCSNFRRKKIYCFNYLLLLLGDMAWPPVLSEGRKKMIVGLRIRMQGNRRGRAIALLVTTRRDRRL